MKWYIRLTVMAALLIFSIAGTAFAEENNGYIVKLKPTAALPVDFEDGYELDQMAFSPQFQVSMVEPMRLGFRSVCGCIYISDLGRFARQRWLLLIL